MFDARRMLLFWELPGSSNFASSSACQALTGDKIWRNTEFIKAWGIWSSMFDAILDQQNRPSSLMPSSLSSSTPSSSMPSSSIPSSSLEALDFDVSPNSPAPFNDDIPPSPQSPLEEHEDQPLSSKAESTAPLGTVAAFRSALEQTSKKMAEAWGQTAEKAEEEMQKLDQSFQQLPDIMAKAFPETD